MMKYMKSQSAMEYLMTYGWAILIIAVVLGVLFQLGVFGGANLAPKATPGSCEVQRTAAGTSLEGMCQGELPQDVAEIRQSSASGVNFPYSSTLSFPSTGTASMWIYLDSGPTSGCWDVLSSGHYGSSGWDFILNAPAQLYFEVWDPTANSRETVYFPAVATNTWEFVAGTFVIGSPGVISYTNGVQSQTATLDSYAPSQNAIVLGATGTNPQCGTAPPFQVANIQLYNTTLSTAEVQALYQEGIGGAPVRPQNIVGWWPLNSNANDYSGNSNDGQIVSIGYSSSWSSGYSAP